MGRTGRRAASFGGSGIPEAQPQIPGARLWNGIGPGSQFSNLGRDSAPRPWRPLLAKGARGPEGVPKGLVHAPLPPQAPAALGLGTHPSHPLVTVLVSWGQSRSQPCCQAGAVFARKGGLHLPHRRWSVSLWKRQERDVWCPGLRSQPRDPTGLGVGAETPPLAPHSSRPPLLGPLSPLTGNRTIPVRASGACGDQGRLAQAQRENRAPGGPAQPLQSPRGAGTEERKGTQTSVPHFCLPGVREGTGLWCPSAEPEARGLRPGSAFPVREEQRRPGSRLSSRSIIQVDPVRPGDARCLATMADTGLGPLPTGSGAPRLGLLPSREERPAAPLLLLRGRVPGRRTFPPALSARLEVTPTP